MCPLLFFNYYLLQLAILLDEVRHKGSEKEALVSEI